VSSGGLDVSGKMNWKALAILSIAHLITDLNQGALPAVLPYFKESLGLSYTMAGTILLFSNVTSSVIQPAFGYLSDRRPFGWLLPVGPVVACAGMAITGLLSSYSALLPCVIVFGLGVASFHPEGFKTAHFFTGEKKATGMSFFQVGGNLGLALGPIFALLLVTAFGLKGVLALAVPGMVIAAILLFSLSWLTAPVRVTFVQKGEGPRPPLTSKEIFPLFLLVLVVTLRTWIQMGLVSYIPFYYITYLNGDPIYAGKLVSVFLLAGAFGTLVGSPLADRWGHKKFLSVTLIMTFPFLFFFTRTHGPLLFLVLAAAGMILVASYSVTVVMAQAIVPGRLGMVSGLMVGFGVGTGGIGVTLLGIIADSWGVPMAIKAILVLPFVAFGLSLLVPYSQAKTAQ